MGFAIQASEEEPRKFEYELLPEGDYQLQIVDYDEKTTQNGDNMVNVQYEVINNENFNGRKVFDNVVFIPEGKKGGGIWKNFLKTISEPYKGNINVNPENWIGKKVNARLSTREYNGRTYNNIKFITPFDYVQAKDAEAKGDDFPF